MGPALGQAIAAQVIYPNRKVVCLLGDSSFGFSASEIETICRYRMPIVIIIINNSGIGFGAPIEGESMVERLEGGVPSTSLGGALADGGRYEQMMHAFGGKGYHVTLPDEIEPALTQALKETSIPSLMNIMISPFSRRKKQKFDWLTREAPAADSKL